jgi:hypothetical protein
LVLAYFWEPQQRGVGHLHLLVPLVGIAVVAGILEELAPVYGFGNIDSGERSRRRYGNGGAGSYLAGGYMGGLKKATDAVEAIQAGVIPRRSWYVAAWLTQLSRVTMRSQRRGRRLWASTAGFLPPPPDTGCWRILRMLGLVANVSGRGPPSRASQLLRAIQLAAA